MADPHAETTALLDERPECEESLEQLLAVDKTGPWTFNEVEADSGTFGELVARGIVDDVGEKYRVADPDAVRAALDGEAYAPSTQESEDGRKWDQLRDTLWVTDPRRWELGGALGVALSIVAVLRLLTVGQVFRAERVVLPGNDPYHYLYWVEQLAGADHGPFAASAIADTLGGEAVGEPLVYTLGWWATIAGGGVEQAPAVVAVIPVIAALLVAVGVYLIGVWTTNDERVGVLAVVFFAFLPGHALYSGVGFFDHHALDYVWLTASIVGIAWLARDQARRDPATHRQHLTAPTTWLVVVALGGVFAAMALNWNGSPILLVGAAVYAVGRTASDIRAGWNPLIGVLPLTTALLLGGALALGVHITAGWQELVPIYALFLTGVGTIAAGGFAGGLARFGLRPRWQLAVTAGLVPPLWIGVRRLTPAVADRFETRITEALLGREGIAETEGLFGSDIGVFFGPLDHFGWLLFVAVPVIGWVGWRCLNDHEPQWLVVISYAGSLLAFAAIQIRFAGEATPVVAICVAAGVVKLLATVDLARPVTLVGDQMERTRLRLRSPALTWQRTAYTTGVIVVLVSLSAFMIPAVMTDVAASDAEAETMAWIDEATADQPDSDYVLTPWGRSRMYNYAVSGESDSYGYAQGTYGPFIRTTTPDQYAETFREDLGYVAMYAASGAPDRVAYTQLFTNHGNATNSTNGSGRFQLEYISADETIKVFEPVTGAVLTGNTTPNTTVTAQTTVTTANRTFSYERQTTATQDGTFRLVVAYPGTYQLNTGTNATVPVSQTAVQNGSRVSQ